jgi:N-acetylgalactosamine-N,N'-diacetylbacillosaminyl-diphospho-undecaprenol 4-alpha-N-acetylgalactosaminyltransferase
MKPKIALFITRLHTGGAEKVVRILLEELKNTFEIHLILTIRHDDMPSMEGIKLFYLTENEAPSWRNFVKIPSLARRYKQYLTENGIAVSLSFLFRPNLIAAFTKILGWRGKVILSERSSPVSHYGTMGFSGKIILQLIKLLYPKADLILPNSFGTQAGLEQTMGIRAQYAVIYNPIDLRQTEFLKNTPLSINLDFSRFSFICVSNLLPYKNQKMLIRAMEKLRYLDCQLFLVGGGEDTVFLTDLIKKMQLQDRVFLLGYQKNSIGLMAKAHCFVTATNAEGFPNAQIEALSLGLPVISTDCMSGPRELLAPTTDPNILLKTGVEYAEFGVLTPIEDLDALVLAMEKMFNDADLRQHYSELGKARALDFAKPIIVEAFEKCLKKQIG